MAAVNGEVLFVVKLMEQDCFFLRRRSCIVTRPFDAAVHNSDGYVFQITGINHPSAKGLGVLDNLANMIVIGAMLLVLINNKPNVSKQSNHCDAEVGEVFHIISSIKFPNQKNTREFPAQLLL